MGAPQVGTGLGAGDVEIAVTDLSRVYGFLTTQPDPRALQLPAGIFALKISQCYCCKLIRLDRTFIACVTRGDYAKTRSQFDVFNMTQLATCLIERVFQIGSKTLPTQLL